MQYIIKKSRLLIFFLILILLTGCWNNRNFTDMAMVVGVGLEKTPTNLIEITVQILNPTIIESRAQGNMQKATNTISAEGKTVFEANRNLLTKINKSLYYSHIQLLIIDQWLAQDGLEDVLDFFQRVHEIDKRELVLISKGISPKELFNIETSHSDISSIEIIDTIKNTNRLASIRRVTLYDVIFKTVAKGNSVIGRVELPKIKENLKIKDLNFTGSAVLKEDKLIGWLNPSETYSFLITDNKFKNPIITVPNPSFIDDNLTIELINCVTKKGVYFNNEKPVLCIKVNLLGKVVEQHGKGDFTSVEQIRALEAEVSQEVKKIISEVLTKAQKDYKTDIFGFGDIIHKKHLAYWRDVKDNWSDVFSDLPIEIDVQYKNRDIGFIKAHK